jgi:hypothetical protein
MVAEVYEATKNTVLIERYMPGREFCIAVAGPVTARRGGLTRAPDPFTFAALERTFDAGERIFTSMDVKPITADRFKGLDQVKDREQLLRLRRLACEVFLEFNLGALIRLDVRSDEHGDLQILEANPKPDLKRPEEGVTSLISAGLPECGMEYDDLILSLFADRLDFLLTHRRQAVRHVIDLLDANSPAGGRKPSSTAALVNRRAGAPSKGQAAAGLESRIDRTSSVLTSGPALSAPVRREVEMSAAAAAPFSWQIEQAQRTEAAVSNLVTLAQKLGETVALIGEVAADLNVLQLNAVETKAAAQAGKDRLRSGMMPVGGCAA